MTTHYIFITGGVCSSLGKGIAAASLATLLQARGFSVRLRKLEQYLNIDSGTMSPIQHGEVYVTSDGLEVDLDFGHYERFTGIDSKKNDYLTMGRVYAGVLEKERRGNYLGTTIQVIPHITNEIKEFIVQDTDGVDFILIEIGGTVGDIEGLAYLEAVRQLRNDLGKAHTLFVHLTLIPRIENCHEIKTKPTQHSVKELLSVGIQPDILLCRTQQSLPEEALEKIALFCNVSRRHVIPACDVCDVYEVPLKFYEEKFDTCVCDFFGIKGADKKIDLYPWEKITRLFQPQKKLSIGLVGKYIQLKDAYKSVIESVKHGAYATNTQIDLIYLDSEHVTTSDLKNIGGFIIPGGFGGRGIEGKLHTIEYARKNTIPFLGICLGMQLCVIEFARNVLGIKSANTTEFAGTDEPVVGLLEEWLSPEGVHQYSTMGYKGGTMRLGTYPCVLKKGSLAHTLYGTDEITERHRHRYEVNYQRYKDRFEANGMIFSGLTPDKKLPEIVEYTKHPFFIGAQFHPEFKSHPFKPHPLFVGLLKAALY